MKFSKSLAILTVMTALAGCVVVEGVPADDPVRPTQPSKPATNLDGTYRLVDIDGGRIPGTATLVIAGNSISGQGPCNSFSTENNGTWPQVVLGATAWTQMACVNEGGESQFMEALDQVTNAKLRDGRLELVGPQHSILFMAD